MIYICHDYLQVGVVDGSAEGLIDGDFDGDSDGARDGNSVGIGVISRTTLVGDVVGGTVGSLVVPAIVGVPDGASDGNRVYIIRSGFSTSSSKSENSLKCRSSSISRSSACTDPGKNGNEESPSSSGSFVTLFSG
eukprot:scaffold2584_cov53-Attheya_sp.AAC.4